MRKHALILALLAPLGLALPAYAQWTNDPYNGMVSVCMAPGQQEYMKMCSLAGDRTLIVWMDDRAVPRLYYQVLEGSGIPLRPENGEQLVQTDSMTGWGQGTHGNHLLPDDLGGCIVVFADYRDGTRDVYGQRLDSLGNRLWGPTGLPILVWPGPEAEEAFPCDMASDSLGNFFVSCEVACGVGQYFSYIFMQKLLPDGTLPWGSLGVPLRLEVAGAGEWQQCVADGEGGVIDCWQDIREGPERLYGQHLDAEGNPLWRINGRLMRNAQGSPISVGYNAAGLADSHGGGYWVLTSPGGYNQLKAYHFTGRGDCTWSYALGYAYSYGDLAVCLQPPNHLWISAGTYYQIPDGYAHRLYLIDTISGTMPFGHKGIANGGPNIMATTDGAMTFKLVGSYLAGSRLTVNRIHASGRLLWSSDIALSNQWPSFYPPAVAAPLDGDNAVVAFQDWRNSISAPDICAQRVNADGTYGNPPQSTRALSGGFASILSHGLLTYELPIPGRVRIELFDVLGRLVHLFEDSYKGAGSYRLGIELPAGASGVYLLRITTPAGRQTHKLMVLH